MENLKKMKECLVSAAENQVYGNLEKVNAEELGEVVDMIKDLAEAIYYCTITESMEKSAWEEKEQHSMYRAPYQSNGSSRGDDTRGRMDGMIKRYDDGKRTYAMYDNGYEHHEPYVYRDGMMHDSRYPMMRDPREGKSGERRRMYMDGKGYKDKNKAMQELESYMQELANDMTEMIQDASPEEKQLLQQKIATLAAKVK